MKKTALLYTLILFPFILFARTNQEYSFPNDTIRLRIYFQQGKYNIDPAFSENSKNLQAFLQRWHTLSSDTLCQIGVLQILGSASAEGSDIFNLKLSQRRAEALQRFIQQYIPLDSIRIRAMGIDFSALQRLIASSDTPYLKEVLDLLTLITQEEDTRMRERLKKQLMTLKGGEPWRYMYKTFFPELRNSSLFVLNLQREPQKPQTEEKDTANSYTPMHPVQIVTLPTEPKPEQSALCQPYMALKTNLLLDAAAIPNIGLEFYLSRGWSIGANWMYAWWSSNSRHRYWRTYGGELYTRRYFGQLAKSAPLSGHHVGVYLQGLTYDVEWGGKGYLSKFSYGAGLEYGYSLPVGRRINIDFTLGLGYLGGKFKTYQPQEDCYVWQSTNNRHWIGPTKAEISFVWLLGNRPIREKKGGKQ
ncbi:DUF3575 domain-containing protein [Bacteroides reticulotermitis]|uniref:DUF3575 domain-containing protein n=1 Tax=Bacteroides reticulotermitis TaxID=1133319 RepID=UPI003A841541